MADIGSILGKYNEEAATVVVDSFSLAKEQGRDCFDVAHLFSTLSTNQQIRELFSGLSQNPQEISLSAEGMLAKVPHNATWTLSMSQEVYEVLQQANEVAMIGWNQETSPYHLLLSLLQSSHPLSQTLRQQGITPEKVERLIATKKMMDTSENGQPSAFWIELTASAKAGKLNAVIGRDKEFRKLIEILSKKEKNNVMILWESGVGKTVIVDLLAQKIASGEVPDFLKEKKILKINLGELLSDSQYRGQFEQKVSALLKEAANPDVLLFIDEIHNIKWMGKTEGSMDMAELLKPKLSDDSLRLIGATTSAEYRKTLEKDAAFSRRFENLVVQEPNKEATLTILRKIEQGLEQHYGLTIRDSALEATVDLAGTYLKERNFPDKAMLVLNQACAKVKSDATTLPLQISSLAEEITTLTEKQRSLTEELQFSLSPLKRQQIERQLSEIPGSISILQTQYHQQKTNWETSEKKLVVDEKDIAQVISEQTAIPLTKLQSEDSGKLLHLEQELAKRVIGQEEAIAVLSGAIRRARIGLKDPKKPMGSFLFLWPTGVGKTELAKALAEQLFGDEKALLRFNMSEFKEEHSVSKLIGAPAGYVGYEEGGILTNKVREKPYSVLLFDEIEKAHPKIFDLFLQVLDDGMLTDAYGHTVDFKNTIILMTSNIGSQEIMDSLQANQVSLPDLYAVEKEGVAENIMDKKEVESSQKKRNRRPKKTLVEKAEIQNASALAKKAELRAIVDELTLEFLRPELVNRFDGNLLFNPMSPEMFKEILDLKLRKKSKQIFEMNGIMITFTNAAKNLLAHKGRDPANGARPIDRAIEKYFVDPLAKEIIGKRFTEGNEVAVDLDLILWGKSLAFTAVNK